MKIIRDDVYYRNKELSVKDAVEFATTSDPYRYSGTIETIEGELQMLREFVSDLVAALVGNDVLTIDDLRELLRRSFVKVEE